MTQRTGIVYGIFYKEQCIYVGSTWNLEERIKNHHKRYMYYKPLAVYVFIKQLKGEWDNVQFKELHSGLYPCSTLLRQDERMVLDCLPYNTLNENLPFLLEEEEIEQRRYLKSLNKEKYAVKEKLYYQANKTRILANKAQKVLCSCGKSITKGNIRHHLLTNTHANLKNRSK